MTAEERSEKEKEIKRLKEESARLGTTARDAGQAMANLVALTMLCHEVSYH